MVKLGIVWTGQLLSILGSGMTRFVLAIWLWEQTGEATALVLVGVFTGVASILTSALGGPLVDRFSRKKVIILADLMVGLATIVLLWLAAGDQLAAWHIYVAATVSGIFSTFHLLAFTATITVVIPQEYYTRANSMMTLAHYGSSVAAPILAGILIGPIGIEGVMLLDVVTFLFAVGTILPLVIPDIVEDDTEEKPTGWKAIGVGFRYILARPPLRGLLMVIFAFTLAESFGYPLFAPMILARTGGDEVMLGIVQSMLGVGGVIGGIVVTIWGGFERKINGVIVGFVLTGLLGDALMGLGRSLPVWLLAAIFIEVFIPLAISSNNTIWQSKVPPHLQGRVFAARNTLAAFGEPIALLLTGLIADHLLEPAMAAEGVLVPVFGGLVGTGPGAGMALLLIGCGLICVVASLWGYVNPSVREIEARLPDHTVRAGQTSSA